MSLIQYLKAAGIRAADLLNQVNDPFPQFTRPAFPKDRRKLAELEQDFYSDLTGNFWICDGQVLASRHPVDGSTDTGDQALWHGIYTAVLALRYSVLYAENDQRVTAVYSDLVQAAKGLQLHQSPPGESQPRLIRGWTDDLKTFQDDASNDSATGHLLGIYFGWKYGPPSLQPVFAQLAMGLGAELLAHENGLCGPDGKPTTYGALDQGWQADPLRVTLCLACYAVGATLTKQPAFMKAYSDLYVKYRPILKYPKVRLWWLDNHNDTHRAAIHLAILSDLTTGDPQQIYRAGLTRLWNMVGKEANVWVEALVKFGGGMSEQDPLVVRQHALTVLSEFTLADKMWNPGIDNDQVLPIFHDGTHTWMPKKILWNGVYVADQPLPRWSVRSQDFFWQRSLRSLDPGSASAPKDSRLNGGDFLAAYWMSRIAGMLSKDD